MPLLPLVLCISLSLVFACAVFAVRERTRRGQPVATAGQTAGAASLPPAATGPSE